MKILMRIYEVTVKRYTEEGCVNKLVSVHTLELDPPAQFQVPFKP